MSSRHIRGRLVYKTYKIVLSGDYTIGNESLIIVNKTVGAATELILPPAVEPSGRREIIIVDGKGDAESNPITLTPAGADTINGAASYVIGANYSRVRLVDAGDGNWCAAAGVELAAAEALFLDGATAGTVVASKALVADADLKLGTLAELAVTLPIVGQGAPTAETGAATLTVAKLLTGIVTIAHSVGSNVNLTLDTGTAMDTGKPAKLGTGQAFDWSVINTSTAAADTATIAAATGHTIVGVAVVQSAHISTGGLYGNVGRFRSRRTGTNTWVTYRIG